MKTISDDKQAENVETIEIVGEEVEESDNHAEHSMN